MGLPEIPLRLFQAMHRHLDPEAYSILLAWHRGAPCAGVLTTRSGASYWLDYAGAASERIPRGTMQLLYWRAVQAASEKGCSEFSFGRTDPRQEGLIAYKRHWNCVESELCEFRNTAKPLPNGHAGGSRTSVARTLLRYLPYPLYRLASGIIYQHR